MSGLSVSRLIRSAQLCCSDAAAHAAARNAAGCQTVNAGVKGCRRLSLLLGQTSEMQAGWSDAVVLSCHVIWYARDVQGGLWLQSAALTGADLLCCACGMWKLQVVYLGGILGALEEQVHVAQAVPRGLPKPGGLHVPHAILHCSRILHAPLHSCNPIIALHNSCVYNTCDWLPKPGRLHVPYVLHAPLHTGLSQQVGSIEAECSGKGG